MRLLLMFLWAVLASYANPASANKMFTEEMCPLGLDLSPAAVDPQGIFVVAVRNWSMVEDSSVATVNIAVKGAIVLAGATQARVPAASGFWRVTLKARPGRIMRVTGSLRVPGKAKNTYFESRAVLELLLREGQIETIARRRTTCVKVEGERRVRYGGMFRVQLDPGESAEAPDIVTQARLTSSNEISCAGCGLQEARDFPVIVTVGKSGRATWVRADQAPEGPIRSAVISGVKHFEFTPAATKDGPVSDAIMVPVRVVPVD